MGRSKTSEARNLVIKRGRRDRANQNQVAAAIKRGLDAVVTMPCRKTTSVFKQQITLVHTTSRETKNLTEKELNSRLSTIQQANFDRIDSPKQIFWAKSLEGLNAMVPLGVSDRLDSESINCYVEQKMSLPVKIEPAFEALSEEAATATLCSFLQFNNNTLILGQRATKKQIDNNPLAVINFEQPLVQIPTVAEQDITIQERRVIDARKRLQELRKSFMSR